MRFPERGFFEGVGIATFLTCLGVAAIILSVRCCH